MTERLRLVRQERLAKWRLVGRLRLDAHDWRRSTAEECHCDGSVGNAGEKT